MRDPYLYEGCSVLKNKLGIKTQHELDDAEEDYVVYRLKDLAGVPFFLPKLQFLTIREGAIDDAQGDAAFEENFRQYDKELRTPPLQEHMHQRMGLIW